jgi:hypothetical protein
LWFLIRVVFWLSIVFSLMPWPQDSARPWAARPTSPTIWARAGEAIRAAIGKAQAKGEKICAKSPTACLEAATKLGEVATKGPVNAVRATSKPSQGEMASRAGSAAIK